MYIVFAILAALASLLAAVTVPVAYVLAPVLTGLGGTISSAVVVLVQFALAIYFAYLILNVLSAIIGWLAPHSQDAYDVDFYPSFIAAISFTITAVFVGIGMASSYSSISQVMDIPFAIWLLIGLVLFAWFDVVVLQGPNRRRLAQQAAIQRAADQAAANAAAAAAAAAAANPPPPAPAAVPRSEPSVLNVLLGIALLVFVGLLLFVFFNRLPTGTGSRAEKDDGVSATFVKKNEDGVPVYHLKFD